MLSFLLWANFINAQDNKIIELKKQLTVINDDKDKINLLFELGKQYEEIDADSCLYFLVKSLNIAQKNHDDQASAKAMSRIGYTYLYYVRNEDKALFWLNSAIKLAKTRRDYLNLSSCYRFLGIISIHQAINNPFELFNLSLAYAKKSNNWKEISDCYELLAINFSLKKEFKKAEEAYLMAMKISKKHDIDTWMSQGLDYCNLLEEQKKFAQSFIFAKKINAIRDKLKVTKGYFVYANDLGRLETTLKNYAKAEGIFLKVLHEEKQKAKIDTFHLFHIFKHLEALYLQQGDYKKTYQASKDVNVCRLWLAQKRQTQNSKLNIMQIKADLALDKKEVEINLLAEQKNKQLLILLAAVLIMILLSVFVIILQRNKEKIEQQKVELEQLNTTKDRLFSMIAHDLRGPIASFKSILNLFNDASLSQEEFVDLSKSLNQNVDNIHTMLDNLLLWSLSQMKGLKPNRKILIVQELVDETISLITEVAKCKQIDLQTDIAEHLKIFADENNMSAIFRNLLNNALKFTAKHGKVVVTGFQRNNGVELSIIDSGVGIKPEDLSTIFSNPKLKTGTAGEKGTGIGLVLCKDLIEQNGGKISVSSEYGKGTNFTIILPIG